MAGAERVLTVQKTAVFKLHNPSRRKRAMLNYALRHNHLAYAKALAAVSPLIGDLVRTERDARQAEASLPKKESARLARQRKFEREKSLAARITATIKPLPICLASKAARSITGSIIGQIESHIELHDKQDSVGVPTAQPLVKVPAAYEAALQDLADSTSIESENAARDRLHREAKANRLRPVLFAGNRASDGFLLLKNSTTGSYFAFLNLVPSSARFAKMTESERRMGSCRNIADLMDLRTRKVKSFRSSTGCLFPLAFGRDFQQTDFLERGSPLAAKLMKRGDDFELHVTFKFSAPAIETKVCLGVDRGIYNLASWSAIDADGRTMAENNVDGRALRFVQKQLERRQRRQQRRGRRFTGQAKRHAADEAVHVAANAIVAAAQTHCAQVIMENLAPLASRGSKRRRSNFNRVLNRSQYQKLQHVLAYKLAGAGLPKAREVHPGYTSQTCPACGHCDSKNREKVPVADGFKMDLFRCQSCGYRHDADLNAARVIALKRLWRDSLSPALRATPMAQVPERKSFATFLKIRAERRGERPCDREVGSSGGAGLDVQCEDGEVTPDGNIVQPRSGPNTPVGKNTPTQPSAVSPSDENPRLPHANNDGAPDG